MNDYYRVIINPQVIINSGAVKTHHIFSNTTSYSEAYTHTSVCI